MNVCGKFSVISNSISAEDEAYALLEMTSGISVLEPLMHLESGNEPELTTVPSWLYKSCFLLEETH